MQAPVARQWSITARDWSVYSLNIGLELYDFNGNLVTSASPIGDPEASLLYIVPEANIYHLHVLPVSTGNPLSSSPSGFTDYGVIGSYEIEVSRQINAAADMLVASDSADAGVLISEGNEVASSSQGTEFPGVFLGQYEEITFTIANAGGSDLNLGANAVSLNQPNNDFILISQPEAIVPPPQQHHSPSAINRSHWGSIWQRCRFMTTMPLRVTFTVGGETVTSITWSDITFTETEDDNGAVASEEAFDHRHQWRYLVRFNQ